MLSFDFHGVLRRDAPGQSGSLSAGLLGDLAQRFIDPTQDRSRVILRHRSRECEQPVAGREHAALEEALVEGVELLALSRSRIDRAIVSDRMAGEMDFKKRAEADTL